MRRAAVVIALAAAVAAAAIAVVLAFHRRHPRRAVPAVVSVMVRGHVETFAAGTTLARLRLRPRAGDLLDVEGKVLRRGAIPGAILVDGRPAATTRALRDGDRITVRNGRDRREPLSHHTVAILGGIPADLQYTVVRRSGTALVVRGAISHKLVRTQFRPGAPLVPPRAGVALTFDDGPSPVYTPQVLGVLRRYHVEATFFDVGYLADAYPQLVQAELAAGMDVGNHTYNHPEVPPFDTLPTRLQADEIALGAQSLQHAGIDPALFRPPAGSASPAVVRAAARLGERVVLWSVDPRDWAAGSTAGEIARSVLAAVQPGSIVDLHDGGGDRGATVAALPAIIRGIRARGLELVTVDGF